MSNSLNLNIEPNTIAVVSHALLDPLKIYLTSVSLDLPKRGRMVRTGHLIPVVIDGQIRYTSNQSLQDLDNLPFNEEQRWVVLTGEGASMNARDLGSNITGFWYDTPSLGFRGRGFDIDVRLTKKLWARGTKLYGAERA